MKIPFIIFMSVVVSSLSLYAKPFWTEKSIYYEGDSVFIVGISKAVSNASEGRIQAVNSAKKELITSYDIE